MTEVGKEIGYGEADGIFVDWMSEVSDFQKTPIYRNVIEKWLSLFSTKNSKVFYNMQSRHPYLLYQNAFGKLQIQRETKEVVEFSFLSEDCKDDLTKRELCTMRIAEFDGKVIAICRSIVNRFVAVQGGVMIAMNDSSAKYRFNKDGLELGRMFEEYALPHPAYRKEMPADVLYATQEMSSLCEVKPCMLKKVQSVKLSLSGYYPQQQFSLPFSLQEGIVVRALKDETENICFPYFHDKDGFILVEPFLKDSTMQLPYLVESYPYDQTRAALQGEQAFLSYQANYQKQLQHFKNAIDKDTPSAFELKLI